MNDKTKRTLLIAVGILLCVALTVGIAARFGSDPQTDDPGISSSDPVSKDPIVDIDDADKEDESTVNVDITPPASGEDEKKPGQDADSDGQEQTIQGDPVKPEPPEPPKPVPEDHDADDIPEEERNTEAPPTYPPEDTTVTPPSEPNPGSKNEAGQVYVPGFGYVDVGDGNDGGTLDDMYENGNKIGIMGGE